MIAALTESELETIELPANQVPLNDIDEEDWPTEFFAPTSVQVASSFALIALGFGITMAIALLGGDKNATQTNEESNN